MPAKLLAPCSSIVHVRSTTVRKKSVRDRDGHNRNSYGIPPSINHSFVQNCARLGKARYRDEGEGSVGRYLRSFRKRKSIAMGSGAGSVLCHSR